MTRAVSVLAFQWISTVWPIEPFGGFGGAISMGRPLSNSTASSAVMREPRLPGRLSTVMSYTRARLPSALSSTAVPPRHRKRAAALAYGPRRTHRSAGARCGVNSTSFQSAGGMVTATIGSGATISANAGRSATPSTVPSNRLARCQAHSSADGICSL